MTPDTIALVHMLRRLEWSGTIARWSNARDGGARCPCCDGWLPDKGMEPPYDQSVVRQYGAHIGHRARCGLAALLDAHRDVPAEPDPHADPR